MRQALIIGNWKMNGNLAENDKLLKAMAYESINNIEVVVCPPSIYMAQVSQQLAHSHIKYGAQNVSENRSGAYTGEVSTAMLHEFGCSYVLLGHSERRSLYHETDAQVANKFASAVAAQIIPVLCVGETLDQRQNDETLLVITEQIKVVIEQVGIEAFESAVIAYEPVWAIGTGETASPEQAQMVHGQIRSQLAGYNDVIANNLSIIYGGSVNDNNADALFAEKDIDGALVGGASLKAASFIKICQAQANKRVCKMI
jgi:triosephosphate isomerase